MTTSPALVIVMGTSGCGKSSIGLSVAQALGVPFVDGDDLHPQSNVDKMSHGTPLTDEDRLPWLLKIRASAKLLTSPEALSTLTHPTHATSAKPTDKLALALAKVHPGSIAPARERSKAKRRAVVVGCSALKVAYRDLLSGKGEEGGEALETYFIYLHGTRALLLNRMQHRPGHFFKPEMLDSQLSTLEKPTEAEENVVTVRLGKGDGEIEEIGMEGVVAASLEAAKRWIA